MTKEIHDINTKAVDFVVELIDYIAEYPDDDYMTMECLCRKLVKHGLIDKVDGRYEPKDEPQTMSDDLIRRSDASKLCIDIVNEFLKSGEFVHLNEAMAIGERFKELPTAEPKRGEWIDDDFVGQYRCSECDYYAIDEYDCCPNCGADMREREGE